MIILKSTRHLEEETNKVVKDLVKDVPAHFRGTGLDDL